MSVITKDLGAATAYAYAVEKGYTGTEAEFAELMADYAEVGQRAEDAAGRALESKTAAQTAATTATNKASEAATSAQTASSKASEASQSASQASGYAQTAETAKTAAQTAKTQAETAMDNAVTAKTAAETAQGKAEDAQAAAETAQGAAEDAAESVSASAAQIATNTADITELESTKADLSELYKAFPTDTASGAIASFPDGADGIPLKSLVVNVNPVQDLHGQDAPYPAGGGKNKLPYAIIESPLTKNGITFVKNQDGSIAVNGTSTSPFAQTLIEFSLPPGSYYFNCGNSISMQQNTYVYIRDIDNGIILANIIIGNIGTDRAFSIDVQTNVRFYMVFGQTGLVISGTLYPMIRLASVTDATYAPYSNICPISGWTEVDVEQSAVNIFDKTSTVNGYIVDSNGELRNNLNCKSTDFIPIVPNTSYYIKSEQTKGALGAWYDKDKNYVAGISRYTASDSDARKTITAPSNARYIRLTVEYYGDGTIYGNAETFSVNYPSTDHDYHPYAGRSITINLGQTVYGGKLNVLSGELTVYPYYASYNGETLTGEWISDRDKYVAGATPTIGAQVVNIGAEGTEYQLDPHEIASLLGANNIWADTGDTHTEYRADTKLYIEKLTQPEEDDMVADSAISSGQFFMVGNSLYRALANIASGATITVGTNAQRVSLADALNLVNA